MFRDEGRLITYSEEDIVCLGRLRGTEIGHWTTRVGEEKIERFGKARPE
jgi:hypothetical protein